MLVGAWTLTVQSTAAVDAVDAQRHSVVGRHCRNRTSACASAIGSTALACMLQPPEGGQAATPSMQLDLTVPLWHCF